MADGYIIIGDGVTDLPTSFNPTPPLPPIFYNGSNYVVSFINPSDRPGVYPAVFKTGNVAPFIFTEEDLVNETEVADFQVFYPSSGGSIIYISYTTTSFGDTIRLTTFDMSTDTWGSVITTAGPIAQQSFHRLIHRSNGDWVVIYNTFVTGQGNVYWEKWNGSSWSSAVKVSTVTMAATDSATVIDAALDESTGNIAIYWNLKLFSEGYATSHKYLTVLSGLDVLGTNYNWQNNTNSPGWETDGRPVYNSAQDQWEYPLITAPSDAPSTYRLLAIAESTPSNDPATTTIIPIIGGQDIATVAFPRLAVDETAQILYFLWANNFQGDFSQPPQMLFITRPLDNSSPFGVTESTNGGGDLQWIPDNMVTADSDNSVQPDTSFTGIAYDSSVDTLIPVPDVTLSVVDLNFFSVDDGTVRMVMNPLCAFQYYFELESAPPEPPTLACPVGGGTATIGVPYSKFLVATGVTGTPTFAITGGALPSGLSLNTLTGEISGTPLVSGEFSITYTVTDSDTDLTSDPITCPIEIPHVRPGRKCPTL